MRSGSLQMVYWRLGTTAPSFSKCFRAECRSAEDGAASLVRLIGMALYLLCARRVGRTCRAGICLSPTLVLGKKVLSTVPYLMRACLGNGGLTFSWGTEVRQAWDYCFCLFGDCRQLGRCFPRCCFGNPSHRCNDIIIRFVSLEEYQQADVGVASTGLFGCLSMSLSKWRSVEQ
jgi:hypothetical protein